MKALYRLRRALADDTGAAAMVIAMVIAVVAFTALSILLSDRIGPTRDLERMQATTSTQVLSAALVYFSRNSTMPCPDTDLDGAAQATCTGTAALTGTLPWSTLGISRTDAIDGFGNYYTYVLSPEGKNICFSVTNDYSNTNEYTGSLISYDDLELRDTSQAAGTGRYIPFAIISHGKNGFGATAGTSVALPATVRTDPTSDAEENNADPGNAGDTSVDHIFSGPASSTSGSEFDDIVYAPTNTQLQETCEQKSPGGAMNAALTENFDTAGTTIDTAKFDLSSSNAPSKTRNSNNNGVARFTAADSYLASDAANYTLLPSARPVYASAVWTPNPGGTGSTTAGFSIVTRAAPPPSSGDDFTTGITFRFGGGNIDDNGEPNSITIRESSAQVAGFTSTGTFSLINNEAYLLEVYDNGDEVWMRITQQDNPANTAYGSAPSVTADLTGDQVVFINNTATDSDLDDIAVGFPMLALEANGTNGFASSAENTNMFAAGAPYSFSLEAWVKPDAYPTGTDAAVIVSKWNTNASTATSLQGYRLYLNGGEVHLSIAGDIGGTATVNTADSGFSPELDEWTHIAATYDAASSTVSFYKNGELARTVRVSLDAADGVNNTAERRFSVGADYSGLDGSNNDTTPDDFFNGQIGDVRVWKGARSAVNIRDNFQKRLSASGSESNLVVNWIFDKESGTAGGTEVVQATPSTATDGTLTNASYAPALATYFRPFSTQICDDPDGTGPLQGYKAGAYSCDFRIEASYTGGVSVTSVNIPSNLSSIYAKVWGAGGGGYEPQARVAGSGGFSQGQIQSIDSAVSPGTLVSIAGQGLTIYVGGGGSGSNSTAVGGDGGGGSGIYNAASSPVAVLAAGGGGGASYTVYDSMSGGLSTCDTDTSTSVCGTGGNGGGPGSGYRGNRPANGGTNCSGRPSGSADVTGPPSTSGGLCDLGGDGPTDATGGETANTVGGGNALSGTYPLRGGGGYTASGTGRIGGGGGGGGRYTTDGGGEAGGHDDNINNSGGYGGGGGGGMAASGVINTAGEAGITTTSTASFQRQGRPDIQGSNSEIDNPEPDYDVSPTIAVGYLVSGTGLKSGASVFQLLGNGNIRLKDGDVVTEQASAVTLTFTPNTGTAITYPGGDDDPYYFPSYLSTTTAQDYPGKGGTTGNTNATGDNSRDGNAGAVVLIW